MRGGTLEHLCANQGEVGMKITRRKAIKTLAGVAPGAMLGKFAHSRAVRDFESQSFALSQPRAAGAQVGAAASADLAIEKGPFEGTRESLAKYEIPKWFEDAKFGIWAHWGPQSAVEQGDWYAREMYIQGTRQYEYHLGRYGHPSKIGYKDLCPDWKAREFDPEHLIKLYKRAGAKYFMSMGVHHDNFDLWNSKYTRWNAVKMGPEKDIVGMWRDAARKHDLRFAVSDHLWISYKWFAVSHGSDTTGPMAGVPYDGVNPEYADLYHDAGCARWAHAAKPEQFGWNDEGVPEAWKQHWFERIRDLVDSYQPDLLYSDGPIPFEDYGTKIVANLYNLSARLNGGRVEAVYTSKQKEDSAEGLCVLDFERGLPNEILQHHWQTDTCIGSWHYDINLYRDHKYKTPKTVIDLLVDIVSQNGNLMLNFPLPNSGVPDPDEMKVLEAVTGWMGVNSEGIYATRPWKVYGEGPSFASAKPGAAFNERARKPLTADDVRFTTKGNTLYAFVMGWPESEVKIKALGSASVEKAGKIANVELLGYGGRLDWKQQAEALRVTLPPGAKHSDYAVTLKVTRT
jgi:alpha-L-fucosidase